MTEPEIFKAISLITGAFLVSWAGVGLFRHWSLRRQLLDIPNERSSHSTPTPRGGGLVIAVAGLGGYLLVTWLFDVPLSGGYVVGAALVAVVSWLDDLYSLSFWARLIIHVGAAAMLIADLGAWRTLPIPFTGNDLQIGSVIGSVLTIIWIVWLLNAYNFMDGIDGIASLQAVVAGLAWVAVSLVLGLTGTLIFAGVLSAISFGFLIHNWQPARIFMGDVGSAFLGFTLAALPLLAREENHKDSPSLAAAGVFFVWFFLFDTVFTFVRRIVNRERVWEAHRSHLYQRMVISGMSHQTVTLLYGLGAAIVASITLFAVSFGGIFSLLTVLSLVVFTALQLYLGRGKKPLT